MIARQVTPLGCHTVRRPDTLVSPVGTPGAYPRGVDEQVDGAGAPTREGTEPAPARPDPADPHADTGPLPVVTAEEAAAALAAHHAHVRDHHAHQLHGHPHVAPPVHHEPPRHAASHRRRTALVAGGVAAVLLAVGGVSAYALTRGDDPATPLAGPTGGGQGIGPGADGSTPSVSGISPASSAPPLAASAPTLVLGDSLGLTVYPWLADLLPDRYVSYEAEVGRSTESAADALEAMTKIPRVVLISSGTNDQNASDVRAQATRILDRLGPKRCVVWVDVVRPDRVGDPQDEINAAIDRAVAGRSNVRVLRWSEMIAEHPEWLSSDGIHPGQEGAQARAAGLRRGVARVLGAGSDRAGGRPAGAALERVLRADLGRGQLVGLLRIVRLVGVVAVELAHEEAQAQQVGHPQPTTSSPAPTKTPEPSPSPTKTQDPPPTAARGPAAGRPAARRVGTVSGARRGSRCGSSRCRSSAGDAQPAGSAGSSCRRRGTTRP